MPTFNDTHVESSQATALTVARGSGVTDYGLQVDESASSAATGLKIKAAAAGSGLAVSTISSGANEDLTVDAKGSGSITIGGTSTGNVVAGTGGGNVGIGTSAPFSRLHLAGTYTDPTTANRAYLLNQMTVAPSADTTGNRVGLEVGVEIPSTNAKTIGAVGAISGILTNNGSGSVGILTAVRGAARSIGGTVSQLGLSGGYLSGEIDSGGTAPWIEGGEFAAFVTDATVTDVYGVYVGSEITGTSTVTNRYGIYVQSPVGTTTGTDFGVYVDGNVANYFAGKVGIGTTVPASRLDIADGALTMQEMTAPASPAANKCVLYAEDNGSGKTRLMVKFATGAAQQIAIEP